MEPLVNAHLVVRKVPEARIVAKIHEILKSNEIRVEIPYKKK